MYQDYMTQMAALFTEQERAELDPTGQVAALLISIGEQWGPTFAENGVYERQAEALLEDVRRSAASAVFLGNLEAGERNLREAYGLINGTRLYNRVVRSGGSMRCTCDYVHTIGALALELGFPRVAVLCQHVRCPEGPNGRGEGLGEIKLTPPDQVKASLTKDLLILRDGPPSTEGMDLWEIHRRKIRRNPWYLRLPAA